MVAGGRKGGLPAVLVEPFDGEARLEDPERIERQHSRHGEQVERPVPMHVPKRHGRRFHVEGLVAYVRSQAPKGVVHAKRGADLRSARLGEGISQPTVDEPAQAIAIEIIDDVTDEEAEEKRAQHVEYENPDIEQQMKDCVD